jgi:hypothetical protein
MKTVRVKKEKLIETLRENRVKHETEYKTLYGLWRSQYIALLAERMEQVRQNNPSVNSFKDIYDLGYISQPMPKSYIADYDTAIQMLEWTQEEDITLDRREFEQYVLDNWGWKNDFETVKCSYNLK